MSGSNKATDFFLYKNKLPFQVCESFLLSHELFFREEIKY
jgi:hypothetical protein